MLGSRNLLTSEKILSADTHYFYSDLLDDVYHPGACSANVQAGSSASGIDAGHD